MTTLFAEELRVSVALNDDGKSFTVSLNTVPDFYAVGENMNLAIDGLINKLIMVARNYDNALLPKEIIDNVALWLNVDSSGSTGPLYNALTYFYSPLAYTSVENDLLALRQYIEECPEECEESGFDILCVEHLLDNIEDLPMSIQVRELSNWLRGDALECEHPDDIESIIEKWTTIDNTDIDDEDDSKGFNEGYSIIEGDTRAYEDEEEEEN